MKTFTCAIIGETTLSIRCGERLLHEGHKILGIVTPHKGVQEWARSFNIPFFESVSALENIGEFDYLFSIVNLRMIEKSVLKKPRKLAINFHDSLLPRYAGLHSTSWAILNNEKEHGISWHIMGEGADTGDILKQVSIPISPDETALSLNVKCYEEAEKAFGELISELENQSYKPVVQDSKKRTYFGRHDKPPQNGFVNWDSSSESISCLVRSLDLGSHPNTLATPKLLFEKKVYIIKRLSELKTSSKQKPGTIVDWKDDSIQITTQTNDVVITHLNTCQGQPVSLKNLKTNNPVKQLGNLSISPSFNEQMSNCSKAESFWVGQLAGLNPLHFPISSVPVGERADSSPSPENELIAEFKIPDALMKKFKVSFQELALSALVTYLFRLTQESKISLGLIEPHVTALANELQNVVSSQVPFTFSINREIKFGDLAELIKNQLQVSLKKGTYLSDLKERYPSCKDVSDALPISVELANSREQDVPSITSLIHFAILNDSETIQVILNNSHFKTDSLDIPTLKEIIGSFECLMQNIAVRPHEQIGNYELLDVQELKKVLNFSIAPLTEFETCKGVQEYFEKQVDETPNHCAIEFNSKQLTYIELEKKSNQLAHYLRELGVKREVFVGILMDRSLEMFVGILGVLKAGGAYVPLDPTYPMDRLVFLFEDIETPVVLTQSHLSGILPAKTPKVLYVDGDWDKEISKYPTMRPEMINRHEDAAYMIYTSGSTGKPKGCPNTHRNVGNYLQFVKTKHPMAATDKLLFRTPYTFDVSVPEILYPLMCGASVVIAAPGKHGDPTYLVNTILEKKITEIGFVPSLLQVFLEGDDVKNCKSIKIVTAIGEALPLEVVRRFHECLPQAKLINSYGPTEAAVAVTYWECGRESQGLSTVPIGYPIDNTRIYILDETGKLAPIGVYGELFIGGVQVARGYWKRKDLTDEKFVRDPFSADLKARMYKTGDRARYLNNGALEYQGRVDFQVKVRGFRIELGEIESILVEHPSIKQSAVVVKRLHGDQGPLSIIAYCVPKGGMSPNPSDLKEFVKAKLPEYMVPAGFVSLDALPLITSGKVDRKILMARQDKFADTGGEKYSPPVNEIEKFLVKTWEEVLKTSPIGRDNNYFSLGGDSLGLIRILNFLRKHNYNLKLEDLYAYQTVASLSELIEGKKDVNPALDNSLPPIKSVSQNSKDNQYPLSFQQVGYWKSISVEGNNGFITLINSLSGPLDVPVFKKCLDRIMERHWVLRTKFILKNGEAFQSIMSPEVEYFIQKDLRDVPEDEVEEAISNRVVENSNEKIDVKKSPPIRCYVSRVHDEQYFIVLKVDHIVFDGISLGIMRNELKELYTATIENRPPNLPEISLQYVDFATWEREVCPDSAGLKKRLAYWRSFLKGLPIFELSTDFPRGQPASDNEVGEGMIKREISKALLEKLMSASKKQNVTLYVTILTAFSLLLQRLSRQNEVVFRTVFSQRPSEIENIMGYFMTLLPMRIDHANKPSVSELIKQVKERSFNSQVNLVPSQLLSKGIESEKDQEALNRLGIIFSYTTGFLDTLDLPGISSELVEIEGAANSLGDMLVEVLVAKNQVTYSIRCDEHLFSDATITKMADLFDGLLLEMALEK